MAQAGFTPIQLYFSSTAAAVPTSGNLISGEVALNTADMKLYAKNSSGVVTLLASSSGATATVSSVAVSGGTTGLTTTGGPITTSGTITLLGTLVAANGGTGQSSYTTGDLLYASGSTALSKLALGTTNFVLTAGAGAPQYVAQSTLAVGSATTAGFATTAGSATTATTATNIAGGIANQIPFQTSAGTTSFIAVPVTNFVLGWNGSAYTWVNAPAATTATNLAGGSAGVVPYQTGLNTTSFTAVGSAGQALVSNGASAPAFATLNVNGGGTGLTSYTTGDILVASSSSTLSNLADIAIGNALLSGGVGVAPSYGKIGLTTHVSGTLPIANGGTGQTTATAAFDALAPAQAGNTGKYLFTNGTTTAWGTVDALPSQTGNAGKYLFTNGSAASWQTTGASAEGVIWENSLVIASNYTLSTNKNGFSVGPITINSGVSVTVPSGQRWVIL
jgi:hypothetical protein